MQEKTHLGWISRQGKLSEKGTGGEEHEECTDVRRPLQPWSPEKRSTERRELVGKEWISVPKKTNNQADPLEVWAAFTARDLEG